jgi:hypothetical protein
MHHDKRDQIAAAQPNGDVIVTTSASCLLIGNDQIHNRTDQAFSPSSTF